MPSIKDAPAHLGGGGGRGEIDRRGQRGRWTDDSRYPAQAQGKPRQRKPSRKVLRLAFEAMKP